MPSNTKVFEDVNAVAPAKDSHAVDGTFNQSDAPEVTEEALQAWLQHEIGETRPDIPAVMTPEISPTKADIDIAERLLSAYAACRADEVKSRTVGLDIWSSIRKLQQRYLETLDEADPEALASYLCNMASHDATIGIVQGDGEHRWLTDSEDYRAFKALSIKDKLISFAEAVGAIRCECPEQGAWGEAMHADINDIILSLQGVVGVDLAPPNVEGQVFKIRSRNALLHDRDLHAQFAAWAMRDITGEGAAVCELGGGVGKAAYWSERFGLGPYTIIDLPHINVLQGFYLLKTLPSDRVRLYGEVVNDPSVTVWPHFAMAELADKEVDLVFTQDSLPEINRETAIDYIKSAKRVSRHWFFSINQEAAVAYNQDFWAEAGEGDPKQNVVGDLVAMTGGFRRVMRAPYWMRKGYVTELFEVLD